MSIEIKDLSRKIDYLLCLYGGSDKKLADVINARAKIEELTNEKENYISVKTLQNWQKPHNNKIAKRYADNIPKLLNIDQAIFIEEPSYSFFKYITNSLVAPINQWRSLNNPNRVESTMRYCRLYNVYYPMLNGSGKICYALLHAYEKNGVFKVKGYFKPGTEENEYSGGIALCRDKVYIIIENTRQLDGITTIIANAPSDFDKLHSFQGVMISTASVRPNRDPTAVLIYIEPIECDSSNYDNEIKVLREKIGQYSPEHIEKSIVELIINDNLPGSILRAKPVDTEKLNPAFYWNPS